MCRQTKNEIDKNEKEKRKLKNNQNYIMMINYINVNDIKLQRKLRQKGVQKLKSKEKEHEKKTKEKEKDIGRLEKENECNKLKCKKLKRKCDRLVCEHEQIFTLHENDKSVGNVGC